MQNPSKIFGRLGNSLFQYAYIYAQMKDGVIPDLYLQDPAYFDKYRDEIRQLFKPVSTPIDMVAIHVRRGDYVGNSFYVNLFDIGYYERAMLEFPDSDFLIFSDDIEWCKNQSLFAGCEFSEGKSELEDMDLISSCKGIIMANSSFSWWASYLSNAKVIAPKEWYGDGKERTKLIKEWKRI